MCAIVEIQRNMVNVSEFETYLIKARMNGI